MEEVKLFDQQSSNSLSTSSSKMKSHSPFKDLSAEDWKEIFEKPHTLYNEEYKKRRKKRQLESLESDPATSKRSPLFNDMTTLECEIIKTIKSMTPNNSKTTVKTKPIVINKEAVDSCEPVCEVTTPVECITPNNSDTTVKTKPTLTNKEAADSYLPVDEVFTAVESITPDKSDSESKINPPIPDKEATDSHLRVAIVNEHNFLGQVSAKTAAYLKGQLSAALRLAVRDGVFVPTFKTWTHTGHILRITCTDIGALDWLSKAVKRIPETIHTKFQVIQEDQLPKITKISLLIPDAKVEEMNEVKKMLALQNVTVKVSSWCIFHKESKDDGLFIVAGTVDEDVAAIEAQGGSIFYEFSTVKVTMNSSEDACPSTSATETNHTCKKAPDCLSFEQLFQVNGPEKENRTHKEIRDRKRKAFQQSNNNM